MHYHFKQGEESS